MPKQNHFFKRGAYALAHRFRRPANGLAGVIGFLVALLVVSPTSATAKAPQVAALCDLAAQRASRDQGVPLDVLRAITRTETGRGGKQGLQPWPWTVNMEGAGKWFETEDEARAYVFSHFKRGARSFDVGCFQINFRWHGKAFDSIDQMFDPLANAQYAARFLRDLHGEFGDWSLAAGAYHSRTPTFANRYKARFDRVLAQLDPADTLPQSLPITPSRRQATFSAPQPLVNLHNPAPLVSQGTARMGSLVPLTGGGSSAQALIVFK
ncbi:transglycosylase SLT domain-containing protein [Phaeobacter sp.]|uniref:transglycosylase SLT domain-containing protein n=1 Tax=Phaeobacter sp. TaxID=1902409 RepID=UPI0025F5664E|nr:transglycosylase SLT domain-containing protein [Phaeobacter sp.]